MNCTPGLLCHADELVIDHIKNKHLALITKVGEQRQKTNMYLMQGDRDHLW